MNRKFYKIGKAAVLLLLFSIFTGCASIEPAPSETPSTSPEASQTQGEEGPVVDICLELIGPPTDYSPSKPGAPGRELLSQVAGRFEGFRGEIEYIPIDEQERDQYLTRTRTEIMAGEGPDVFICFSHPGKQLLFPFPEKAMGNRLFLPLDSYIEKAEYVEWDRLLPIVMEKGKNQEGQQVLPLTYDFPLFLLDRAEFPQDYTRPMTWDEMAESGDPALVAMANHIHLGNIFGELCDFQEDTLTFTEEDLLAYSERQGELQAERVGIVPQMTDGFLTYVNDKGTIDLVTLEENGAEYTMLPGYNISGGVTANICTFAAINRNTDCPDESFMVLDYLLSKDAQRNSSLYQNILGLPVHMEAGSREEPLHGRYMSEWNFQEFELVRGQINAVNFYSPIYGTLGNSYQGNGDDLEAAVHREYVVAQMMLAES